MSDQSDIPMPEAGAEIIGFYLSDDNAALDKFGEGGYRALAGLDDWDDEGKRLYIFEPDVQPFPDTIAQISWEKPS